MNQNSIKKIIFTILLILGVFIIYGAFSTSNISQNNKLSFVPLFQLFGKAPQALSRSVTKILLIDSVDERELAKKIGRPYGSSNFSTLEGKHLINYLNSIIDDLQKYKKKSFKYEIRLLNSSSPNAMALPGGIIFVTTGLIKILKSESELVAVIAHEMGHIELSHCLDSVKYEILSKKILHNNLGALADFARRFLVRHSFSKNQEDEADTYGFNLLKNSKYDPSAMFKTFSRLKEASKQNKDKNISPFRDYFMSHPPIDQRLLKFQTESKIWWNKNDNELRYIGIKNLKEKKNLLIKDFGKQEWISKFSLP